jgi:hypothetical protein
MNTKFKYKCYTCTSFLVQVGFTYQIKAGIQHAGITQHIQIQSSTSSHWRSLKFFTLLVHKSSPALNSAHSLYVFSTTENTEDATLIDFITGISLTMSQHIHILLTYVHNLIP